MSKGTVGFAVLFARHLVRVPGLIGWIVVGIPLALLAALAPGSPARRLRLRARLTRIWMRGLLVVLGVHTRVRGLEGLPRPVLLTANHLSWLDILVLSAVTGSIFVSKAEVANWPLLGWFARAGGTVFVRRGDGDSAREVHRTMTAHLRAGARLVFFPEGTTGDGSTIRRFRPRLFESSLETGVPVCPVTLHYRERTGRSCSETVAFVGDETIVANLLRLLARPRFDAEVVLGPVLETDGLRDTRSLAQAAERVVRTTYDRLHGDTKPLADWPVDQPVPDFGELRGS